ncbi:DUF2877 domain-containing protein [Streptomyces sp. NPDC006422]|uniref:DUF2877 domain-containing protein n=1 Tax=unclassified Streptomyces TaxID=2593676 RepID=UPI0033A3486E
MARPAPTSPAALSIDAELARLLRHGPVAARVESVFARVINLLTSDDQLVSLCVRRLDDAPWSVRVDVEEWNRAAIRIGVPVTLDSAGIAFGGTRPSLAVTLDAPHEWHAKSVPLRLTGPKLAARADALDALTRADRTPSANAFEAAMATALRRGQDAIHHAVRADDRPGTSAAVEQLLGLGPGLTPSGDDFLTGLALLAAQPGSRMPGYLAAVRDVLERLPDRTTLLSRTTLVEALRGRARQSLLDVLHPLLDPAEVTAADLSPRLRPPVDRVLAIGHTSGADLLSGLLAGLRLEAELKQN